MSIRVLLADDHPVVLEGLRALLEREGFVVAGEASDGREAVRLTEELHPDVAVLDRAMPGLNGQDAAVEIGKVSPGTRTILLTMYNESRFVVEALRAGVRGYVLKTRAAEELLQAIREVQGGNVYLSPSVSHFVVEALQKKEGAADPLTPREREVLQLIAEGNTTKQIASVLNLSSKTIESHRARIMEKLDVHDTAALVRYAVRQGLIQP